LNSSPALTVVATLQTSLSKMAQHLPFDLLERCALFIEGPIALVYFSATCRTLSLLLQNSDPIWVKLRNSVFSLESDHAVEQSSMGIFISEYKRRIDEFFSSQSNATVRRSLLGCGVSTTVHHPLSRSLQDAITEACFNDTDTLVLGEGHYEVESTLHVMKPISIVADRPGLVTIMCRKPDAPAIHLQLGGRMRNITVCSEGGSGILIESGHFLMEDCELDTSIDGCEVSSQSTAHLLKCKLMAKRCAITLSHGVIDTCSIIRFGSCGVEVGHGNVDVLRCHISGEAGYGLQYSCGAGGRVFRNMFDDEHMVHRGDILAGILVESGSDPIVNDNKVMGKFRNAIYSCDSGRGTFMSNTFVGFTRFGVVIMSKAQPLTR